MNVYACAAVEAEHMTELELRRGFKVAGKHLAAARRSGDLDAGLYAARFIDIVLDEYLRRQS